MVTVCLIKDLLSLRTYLFLAHRIDLEPAAFPVVYGASDALALDLVGERVDQHALAGAIRAHSL